LRVPLALAGFFLLGPAYLPAQDLETLRVDVPFSFKVGQTVFPAGKYEVRYDEASMPGVLRIHPQDGRGGAFVLTERTDVPSSSGHQARLVFENDGSQYVLQELLDPGDGVGVQVIGAPRPASATESRRAPAD
jgi:hypothetical protein